MGLINYRLLDEKIQKKLRKEFKKNKPFSHLLIKNFLNEEEAERIAEALIKEDFEEKDSDLFQLRQTQNLEFSKNKVIKEFYKAMRSKEVNELIQSLTGLKLKKGKIDMAGSLLISTDYLLCHDDELEDRKVAYVFYLCEDFVEKDGGALALLEDVKGRPGRVVKRYFPVWNSLMIFKVSKKSWHEVEEVISDKKRYAIGGWFY